MIKYIKSVLWRVAKRLSYIEDARCLKVNNKWTVVNGIKQNAISNVTKLKYYINWLGSTVCSIWHLDSAQTQICSESFLKIMFLTFPHALPADYSFLQTFTTVNFWPSYIFIFSVLEVQRLCYSRFSFPTILDILKSNITDHISGRGKLRTTLFFGTLTQFRYCICSTLCGLTKIRNCI
jgi:hypothetical protein